MSRHTVTIPDDHPHRDDLLGLLLLVRYLAAHRDLPMISACNLDLTSWAPHDLDEAGQVAHVTTAALIMHADVTNTDTGRTGTHRKFSRNVSYEVACYSSDSMRRFRERTSYDSSVQTDESEATR